jgi:hypothetical protein
MEIALRQTQTSFLCLENKPQEENVDVNETVDHTLNFQTNDGFNISRRMVSDAAADGSLQFIASTFDPVDNIIRPGVYEGGRKIISLAGVLGADVFPLADIMQKSLQLGAEEMRRPVEIEVACNLHDDRTATFYLLQIRPIVDSKQELNEDLLSIPDEDCILRSHNSLGHGVVEGLEDIVYVKMPDDGTLPLGATALSIQDEIDQINDGFLERGESYVLVGPGRWGSSDEWLGVPVKWPNISGAKLIVEELLPNKYIDPSQGTHFFQNLTSLGVGYFTVDLLSREYFDSLPAVKETKNVRHIKLPKPATLKMDGMKGEGVLLF